MSHDEMIAVIQHHKNGGKVEYKHVDNSVHDYSFDPSPSFDFATFDYRPQFEPRSLWEVRRNDGTGESTWYNEVNATNRASDLQNATIHEHKEVLP